MFEALQLEFIQRALIAGLLISVACGVIGTYVVVKRIVFISGGISHASLGGVGIALWMGVNPLLGATVFCLLSAVIVGVASVRGGEQEDTVIGTLWSLGAAIGLVFMGMAPGIKSTDAMSYFQGYILLTNPMDLLVLASLDALILGTVWLFYKEFMAVTLDDEFAELRGLPVSFLYILLLCLVALTVAVMIKAVGIILVIALLTLPAAISRWFTSRLHTMMILACLLCAAFTSAGILTSYKTDWPSGASIILIATAVYGTLGAARQLWHRFRTV